MPHQPKLNAYLEERRGEARQRGKLLCLMLLKACFMRFASYFGLIRQTDPFPGWSCGRGSWMNFKSRDKLLLILFYKT